MYEYLHTNTLIILSPQLKVERVGLVGATLFRLDLFPNPKFERS